MAGLTFDGECFILQPGWQDLRQLTQSFPVDCPKLGRDVRLLFIVHLALGDVVYKGAPFRVSPFDLELDAH